MTSLGGYSERDVSSLLGLSVRQIRSFAQEGLLAGPAKGEADLSFEDVVLLRAAKGLVESHVSPRRVRSMLKKLRAQLPRDRPLSGVRISVEGQEIVVRDGSESWDPESGQILFDFDEEDLAGDLRRVAERPVGAPGDVDESVAQDWYERGCELEGSSSGDARAAYLRALEAYPEHFDSHLNLGRLLHEARDFRGAESHYRAALSVDPSNATAAFNLGVVLEDVGLSQEALEAYQQAIDLDPTQVDPYHNAVRLMEAAEDKPAAVRLLKRLRDQSR